MPDTLDTCSSCVDVGKLVRRPQVCTPLVKRRCRGGGWGPKKVRCRNCTRECQTTPPDIVTTVANGRVNARPSTRSAISGRDKKAKESSPTMRDIVTRLTTLTTENSGQCARSSPNILLTGRVPAESGRSVRVAHLRQWLSAPARHSTFNDDSLRCTVVPSTPAAQKHRMTGRRHHNRLESARHSARSLLASAPPAAFRLSRTRCPLRDHAQLLLPTWREVQTPMPSTRHPRITHQGFVAAGRQSISRHPSAHLPSARNPPVEAVARGTSGGRVWRREGGDAQEFGMGVLLANGLQRI